MDDVLQQEIQDRAAVVDALDDLKASRELGNNPVRPNRLRRIRSIPVLDRKSDVFGFDLASPLPAPGRRELVEELPNEPKLKVRELKLPWTDKLIDQEESGGAQPRS